MRKILMVLCACACVGGVRATVDSSSYVQAGLCGQWDGIDNLARDRRCTVLPVWCDLTGGTGDGTLNANVTWMPSGWYNGEDGQPVTLTKAFAQVMNTRTFTLEYVVTPTRKSARETLLGVWNTGNWCFEHNSGTVTDGSPRFFFNSSPDFYASGATITNGETAVIALVVTPGGFSVYKNGTLANSHVGAVTAPTANVAPVVGGDYMRPDMAFRGTYHALRLYDTALSAADVKANADVDVARYVDARRRMTGDVREYLVRLAPAGGTLTAGGAAAPAEQWVAEGTTLALAFTPGTGVTFTRWAGDVHAITTGAQTDASVTVTVNGPVDLVPVVARTTYCFMGPDNTAPTAANWQGLSSTAALTPDFTDGQGVYRFDKDVRYQNSTLAANSVLKMFGIEWRRNWGGFYLKNGKNSAIELGAGGMRVINNSTTTFMTHTQVRLTADQVWDATYANTPIYAKGGVSGPYTLVFTGLGVKFIGGTDGSYNEYDWPRSVFMKGSVALTRANLLPKGHELVFAGGTLDLDACDQTIENGVIRTTAAGGVVKSGGTSVRKQLILNGAPALDPMGFNGRFTSGAGLCWNPTDAARTFTFTTGASDTQGKLSVLNGTLRVAGGASFSSLSAIEARGAAATFELAADAGHVDAAALTVADGAKVKVAAGTRILADSVKANGAALAAGTYTSATADWIEGAGSVVVAGDSWQGAGADTHMSTEGNWSGTPDLTGGAFTAIFAAGGTRATLAENQAVNLRGIQFDGTRDFTLDAEEGASATLGAAGLSTADGAHTYTNAWPLVIGAPQTWSVGANASLTVSGGLASGASASDALTCDGAGTLTLTGSSTFTNPLYFNKGTYVVQGTNVLGTGTTAVHVVPKNATVRFRGGRETRPICFDQVTGGNYELFYVDAGEQHFNGKVKFYGGKGLTIAAGATLYCHGGFETGSCHNHNGPGTLVIDTVPMVQADRFYHNAGLVVELRVAGNKLNGNAGNFNDGTLKTMVPYAITNLVGGTSQRLNMFAAARLDLCGCDQAIGVLGCAAGSRITSATPALLHLVDSYVNTEGEIGAKRQTNSCCFAGCAGLSKEGTLNYWLRGVSSTTGTLQVVKGTLTMESAASWANSTNVVVTGTGTLKVQNAAAFGEQADITVNTGATMDLDYTGTMPCRLLWLDGAKARFGKTYGGPDSAATVKSDLFRGTGLLYVKGDCSGTLFIVR